MKKLKEAKMKINKTVQNLQSNKVALFIMPPTLAAISVFLSTTAIPFPVYLKKALILIIIIILGIWNCCLLKGYIILINKRNGKK